MQSPGRIALLLTLAGGLAATDLPYFTVLSADTGAWPAILSSIGLEAQPAAVSRVFVARSGSPASAEWFGRRGTRFDPNLGGRVLSSRDVWLPPQHEGFRQGEQFERYSPPGTSDHLGNRSGTSRDGRPFRCAGFHPGALEFGADDGWAETRRRRGAMGQCPTGRARI